MNKLVPGHDKYLEPPYEEERLVPVRDAPVTALLREAINQIGDEPGHIDRQWQMEAAIAVWLKSIPVVEVELTPEEWAAFTEDPRIP